MPGGKKADEVFFAELCESCYEKVLRYLFYTLRDEGAARDCTQEVFLTALQKSALLRQHPNPGGFLFQTAKNLARKARREGFERMLREELEEGLPDPGAAIETALDREIDEQDYVGLVLEGLSEEKRKLYAMHYQGGSTMREIAARLGMEEAAVRMRFVRLRREIQALAAQVAGEYFIS